MFFILLIRRLAVQLAAVEDRFKWLKVLIVLVYVFFETIIFFDLF